jgi:hypothetical protein
VGEGLADRSSRDEDMPIWKISMMIPPMTRAAMNEPAMIAMSLPLLEPEGWGPIGPPA